MAAYYNEIDAGKILLLRELIKEGAIADGIIDTRPIQEVQPGDVAGFTQCHWFAGIGVWSYALRLAGVPDDYPCWTGSCPCPPFSQAGRKKYCPECESGNLVWSPGRTGAAICADCRHVWIADERHLYPEWWRLIVRCRPAILWGEQVSSPDGITWLSAVRASLEIAAYDPWASDLTSSGFGAPTKRQRLFFVGRANEARSQGRSIEGDGADQCAVGAASMAGAVGGSESNGWGRWAHDLYKGWRQRPLRQAGPTGGFWSNAEWVECEDGKWRSVEPAPVELAPGTSSDLGCVRFKGQDVFWPHVAKTKNRVMRLRGAGDAICAEVAAEFIEASFEHYGIRSES